MFRDKSQIEKLSLRQLANRVFVFESSPSDEKYFRQKLYELAAGQIRNYEGFNRFLWHEIFIRNDGGKTIKYLYFNERAQKLYVDWYFEVWAEKAFDEIENRLTLSNQA